MSNVGIWSIGTYLPELVRKNDWWPEAIVEQWRQRMQENLVRPRLDTDDLQSEGARRTLLGMKDFATDPFKGAVERRVMPEGMVSSDMEAKAAQDALARAQVPLDQVDLLLTHSQLQDHLGVPNASTVHRKLGLRTDCFTLAVEGACNSFMLQLSLAEAMIRSGRAKLALLVQSSGFAHLARQEDHHSAWFGDGATAVLVGPVAEGKGVLGQCHRTDGSMDRALITSCPGLPWYRSQGVGMYLHNADRDQARKMLLIIADLAKDAVDTSLSRAGLTLKDVDFYATHQSTRWFRETTQSYIGLDQARSVDTFAWTGSLAAANVPFMLAMGEREGLLRNGDLVAAYSGGSGITWSGFALRWGR